MAGRVVLTRAPDGSEYEIVVEPAPRISGFRAGPVRWWNTVTRAQSWWVSVSGEAWPWRVLRERFATEAEADRRGHELERLIAAGKVHPGGPTFRRHRSD